MELAIGKVISQNNRYYFVPDGTTDHVRLTKISMAAAMSPEVDEIKLESYLGSRVVVEHERLASDWAYRATLYVPASDEK